MEHLVSEKALRCQEYMEREADVRHHTFEEENYQYELLTAGDPRALEVFDSGQQASDRQAGKVSEDPIRNAKYLTVVCIATACRAAMRLVWTPSGPMPPATCISGSWICWRRCRKSGS